MSKSKNTDLLKQKQNLEREIADLELQKDTIKKILELTLKELQNNKDALARLFDEKIKLQKEVEGSKKEKPSMTFEDLSKNLKLALSSVQETVASRVPSGSTTFAPANTEEEINLPQTGDYVVDKFEVELKSGIDLKEGIRLVQPDINNLTPESLSTVRISLKAKPIFKVIGEEP
jgi:hypothetical protein